MKTASPGKIMNIAFVILTLLLLSWCWQWTAGVYYGNVNGLVFLTVQDQNYSLQFQARTRPKWQWSTPVHFRYSNVILTLKSDNQERTLKLQLPGPTLPDGTVFSSKSLGRFVTNDSLENLTNSRFTQQVNALHRILVSLGNGTFSKPRHHPYFTETPLNMSYSHFCLGGGRVHGLIFWVLWLTCWSVVYAVRFQKRKSCNNVVEDNITNA